MFSVLAEEAIAGMCRATEGMQKPFGGRLNICLFQLGNGAGECLGRDIGLRIAWS